MGLRSNRNYETNPSEPLKAQLYHNINLGYKKMKK